MTTMPNAARAAPPTIAEDEWDRILERIEGGTVIPVIGEHLTVMRSRDQEHEMTLVRYLAERLGVAEPSPDSLDEIAFRYLQKHGKGGLDDLYTDIFRAVATGGSVPLPTPLKQLAEIRHFGLFVTTSFDPYLALALNEVRFGGRASGGTRVLAYERTSAVDIPQKYNELDYPIVYHLFGRAQALPMFAVTDEDVLEFVHTLQAPESQPPNLMQALQKQRLLVVGTRLTGWLTRFFLRISSADRLRDSRRTDLIVDLAAHSDADQLLFFEHFGNVKLLPMPPVRFIDELVQRWRARHPELVTPRSATQLPTVPPGPDEVFLSYASEDLEVVKALRERLAQAQLKMWMDRDALRGGEQWEHRILDALRRCAICIPVISAHATSGGFRYVRTEWERALELQAGMRADRPFIFPLVIDETRPDDPALHPGLRALHWRRLGSDDDMQRFVSEIRDGVEKARSR